MRTAALTSRALRRALVTCALVLGLLVGLGVEQRAAAATAPTIELSASAASVDPSGTAVTFTATVTGDTVTASDKVAFSVGGGTPTKVALQSAGGNVWTATYATRLASSVTVKAAYVHGLITSSTVVSTLTLPVAGGQTTHPTAVALSFSPSTVVPGDTATFTATVTETDGGGGIPTGTVEFFDNGYSLGEPVALDANGTAALTRAGFGAGTTHSFTAAYSGDANNLPSTSSASAATVASPPTAVQTTISLTATPNPVPSGAYTTLSVHVEQVGTAVAPPAGEVVTFWNADSGISFASAQLDGGGDASVQIGGWTPGHYNLKATYVGDLANQSSSITLPIDFLAAAPPTLTVKAPSPTITYGDAIPSLTPTYDGFTGSDDVSSLDAAPTCTTTATAASAPGAYPVTCTGARSSKYVFSYVAGTLTIGKAQLTVTPNDATMVAGSDVPPLGATITGFVNGETLATSDVTGTAACTTTATSDSPAGTYPITCTTGTLASADYTFTVAGAGTLTVDRAATTLIDLVSGPVLADHPVQLGATLLSGSRPVAGETLTLSLGGQSCTGVTNSLGTALCTVTPTGPLGPTTSTATFGGDDRYLASSDTKPALLYAFARGGGAFVVGDGDASGHVTFWSSQWAKKNSLSQGSAPASFKGFAAGGSLQVGGTWSTGPGNSSSPPGGPLPAYMAVLVTSSVGKSGSSISGNVERIVIVKTDPGYDGNPGHDGTGTVVATVS